MTGIFTGCFYHIRSGIFTLFDYSLDDEFDDRTLRRNSLVFCFPRKSRVNRDDSFATRRSWESRTSITSSLIFHYEYSRFAQRPGSMIF